MEVEFHPSALAELDASVAFYESRLEGLGMRFLAEVEEATVRISASPDTGARLAGEFRRRLVRGFPFSLVYRLLGERVVVVAVAHQHRRPGYWRRRTAHR